MATLPYALLDGLKHAVSRHNLLTLTPTNKHKRSKSLDNINKIWKKNQAIIVPSRSEVKRSKTDVASRFHRAGLDERYTPSIGSRASERSVVSSTVEVAAHLARSSMMSSKAAGFGTFKVHAAIATFCIIRKFMCYAHNWFTIIALELMYMYIYVKLQRHIVNQA